jgi:hypothetical protein
MGEEIQGLDPGLLKLGKIQGLLPTVNTNTVNSREGQAAQPPLQHQKGTFPLPRAEEGADRLDLPPEVEFTVVKSTGSRPWIFPSFSS